MTTNSNSPRLTNAIKSFFVCGCALGMLSTGCATATNGVNQSIPISSNPTGATVIVDGTVSSTTPCRIDLARKSNHSVTITADGYAPETREITKRSTGAIHGNFWLGGLIGLGVDAVTGANNELVPGSIHVNLVPQQAALPRPQSRLANNFQSTKRTARRED